MADPKRSRAVTILIVLAVLAALAVPCIGILAAIAIPAFVNYTRRARTVEARTNVAAIARGVENACSGPFVVRGADPLPTGLPGAAGPTPPVPSGTRVSATWGPEWAAVGFGPSDPVSYSYSMIPDGPGALLIRAEGDLDGDGVRSRFESRCTSSGTECACGEVVVTDELE